MSIACSPPDSSTSVGTESSASTSDSSTFVPTEQDTPNNHCDPLEQDCPEDEKCVPYSSTGGNWDYKCVPVLGNQAPGQPCTSSGTLESTDDCDETSWCYDGECAPFCMGPADALECPPGTACLVARLLELS